MHRGLSGTRMLLLFVTTVGLSLTNVEAGNPLTRLNVSFISCLEDASLTPTLEVSPWGSEKREAIAATSTGSRVYAGHVDLPPGYYTLGGFTPHCRSASLETVAIIPGHSRSVVLVASSRLYALSTTYNAAVAFAVPEGINVRLESTSSWNLARVRYGVRDEAILYFSDLAPDEYIVELSASKITACFLLEVKPNAQRSFLATVDIDMRFAATALGSVSSQSCPPASRIPPLPSDRISLF